MIKYLGMTDKKITIYNKLIRDKIPELMGGKGLCFETHIADNEEYARKLRDKLQEEVSEFLEDESREELADILEVINAIIFSKGWSCEGVEQIRKVKADERGGFEKKIILEQVGG